MCGCSASAEGSLLRRERFWQMRVFSLDDFALCRYEPPILVRRVGRSYVWAAQRGSLMQGPPRQQPYAAALPPTPEVCSRSPAVASATHRAVGSACCAGTCAEMPRDVDDQVVAISGQIFSNFRNELRKVRAALERGARHQNVERERCLVISCENARDTYRVPLWRPHHHVWLCSTRRMRRPVLFADYPGMYSERSPG